MATFDFSSKLFSKLLKMMPHKIAEEVRLTLSNRPPVILHFSRPPVRVNIETNLGTKIEENKREHYVPLQVKTFK